METRTGVEPVMMCFADTCLTTWLPRHRATEEKEKMVVGEGFEPSKHEAVSLQPTPFDHFGIPPY